MDLFEARNVPLIRHTAIAPYGRSAMCYNHTAASPLPNVEITRIMTFRDEE